MTFCTLFVVVIFKTVNAKLVCFQSNVPNDSNTRNLVDIDNFECHNLGFFVFQQFTSCFTLGIGHFVSSVVCALKSSRSA